MEKLLKEYETYLNNSNLSESTIKGYLNDVKKFTEYSSENKLDIFMCRQFDVKKYFDYIKKSNVTDFTVYRNLSSIKNFYNFLQKSKYIKEVPINKMKISNRNKPVPKYIEKRVFDRIISETDEKTEKGIRDRCILYLMFYCGLKATETTELKLNNINISLNILSINTVTGFRVVHLNDSIKELLRNYLKTIRPNLIYKSTQPNENVFLNLSGNPISRQGVWKIIKYYSKLAGVKEKINPNIIRNSFAIYSLQNGITPKQLKELLGYNDSSTIRAYTEIVKNTAVKL